MASIEDVFEFLKSAGPALAVLGSVAGILVSWARDRQMRRKEYADRIRQAAAMTVAKVERWQQIFLAFFQEVQKEVTQADVSIVKRTSAVEVRDAFWLGVVDAYGRSNERLLAEEIEIAYANLYGYDPRIHALFGEAIRRLRLVSNLCYVTFLDETQSIIIDLAGQESTLASADLGNALRNVVNEKRLSAQDAMQSTIEPFREEVLKLIRASDASIIGRKIDLKPPERVFRSDDDMQKQFAFGSGLSYGPGLNALCLYEGVKGLRNY